MRDHSGSLRLRWQVLGICFGAFLCCFAEVAFAATASAVGDSSLAQVRQAQSRANDADTLLSLTGEGAILYGQDEVKLDGYQ